MNGPEVGPSTDRVLQVLVGITCALTTPPWDIIRFNNIPVIFNTELEQTCFYYYVVYHFGSPMSLTNEMYLPMPNLIFKIWVFTTPMLPRSWPNLNNNASSRGGPFYGAVSLNIQKLR